MSVCIVTKSLVKLAYFLMGNVIANGLVKQGSIQGRAIQNIQKLVLDTSLLKTQYYKVSREKHSVFLHSSV